MGEVREKYRSCMREVWEKYQGIGEVWLKYEKYGGV